MSSTPPSPRPVSPGSAPVPAPAGKGFWGRIAIFVAVHVMGILAMQWVAFPLWMALSPGAEQGGPTMSSGVSGIFWAIAGLIPTLLASFAAWRLPHRMDLRLPGFPVGGGRFVALCLIGLAAVFLGLLIPDAGLLAWGQSSAVLTMLGAVAQSWVAVLISSAGSAVAVFAVLWPLWRSRLGPWAAGACAALTVSASGLLLQVVATIQLLVLPSSAGQPAGDLSLDSVLVLARILAWMILAAGVATLMQGSAPLRRILLGALAVSGASASSTMGWAFPDVSLPAQLLPLLPSVLVGVIAWLWGRASAPDPVPGSPHSGSPGPS